MTDILCGGVPQTDTHILVSLFKLQREYIISDVLNVTRCVHALLRSIPHHGNMSCFAVVKSRCCGQHIDD